MWACIWELLRTFRSLYAAPCIQIYPKTPVKGALGPLEHLGGVCRRLGSSRGQYIAFGVAQHPAIYELKIEIDLWSPPNVYRHCQSALIGPAHPLQVLWGVFGCMWMHTTTWKCAKVPICIPYGPPSDSLWDTCWTTGKHDVNETNKTIGPRHSTQLGELR